MRKILKISKIEETHIYMYECVCAHVCVYIYVSIFMITPTKVLLTKACHYANYTKFNPQESNLPRRNNQHIITTQVE